METDKALQKLEDMPLADRIAAVAADVDSKWDEFRSIDTHELASLLGIVDADQPGPRLEPELGYSADKIERGISRRNAMQSVKDT
jgi:hypothetical protein